jgi:hypothetical protein
VVQPATDAKPGDRVRRSGVLREGEKVAQGIWCGGLALVAALGLSMGAEASDEPRARAVLVDEAPILDGVLDDPIWQKAEVVSDFTQVVPIEGAPPSFRTEVRFLTNNESLFIAFRAFDPEPDKIIANLMGRDEFLFFDDNFTLVFDTFHDHRNGFFIQVNPLGGRRDASFERDDFQQDWDGIWYAKAQIDDQGWVAEIEIPFRTFSIKPGGDIWGLNMTRRLRRFNEDDRWADPTVERLLVNMGRAGVLEGLAGADQGLGLDVVPSGSVGGYHDEIENDGDVSVEPSLDAFYRLLPSLTASLTVNTDFAQTEVDDQQINFTRFDLFFPEKRQFFLEDGGIFSFGGLRNENGIPFFSRRIGLAADGDSVRLPVGGKVAGRVGRYSIGALNILQDRHGAFKEFEDPTREDGIVSINSTNLSVARVSANVLEESSAGFIVTHGDPLTNEQNALVGTDFNYRSSSLIKDHFFRGDFWFQQTFSEDDSGEYDNRSGAWGFQLAYPNDRVNWALKYKELQDDFNPALGFVNRVDIRRYDARWRYRIRPPGRPVLRTLDTEIVANLVTDRDDNTVQSWSFNYFPFRLTNQVDDTIQLRIAHLFDRVPANQAFFLVPHVGVEPGSYTFSSAILKLETSRSRRLRFSTEIGYGGLYDGTGGRLFTLIEWRPSPHFLLALEHDERRFENVRAHHGGDDDATGPTRNVDFSARISRVRVRINFTPDMSWSTFVQYDNISDEMSAQSTFRWIIKEGNQLFIILGQDFDATPHAFRVGRTEPVAKLSWTFRF